MTPREEKRREKAESEGVLYVVVARRSKKAGRTVPIAFNS